MFLEILRAHRIERVLDVRRFPVSRRYPHFMAQSLSASLVSAGISYAGMPELGGRRRARPDSPHAAWKVETFRGYADFMDTPEFVDGLERLMALGGEMRSVLMCAEALPWRCHRSLIADALLARGWKVFEILSGREARGRKLPDFARLEGARVIYDGPQPTLPL
ncbi:MAG TPA: DUF488 domain-containing protein [Thermoanaerobaculia bacterium]|nr:DUF488 domain-containing protein [Thermoanaerobaculia bacterium]